MTGSRARASGRRRPREGCSLRHLARAAALLGTLGAGSALAGPPGEAAAPDPAPAPQARAEPGIPDRCESTLVARAIVSLIGGTLAAKLADDEHRLPAVAAGAVIGYVIGRSLDEAAVRACEREPRPEAPRAAPPTRPAAPPGAKPAPVEGDPSAERVMI